MYIQGNKRMISTIARTIAAFLLLHMEAIILQACYFIDLDSMNEQMALNKYIIQRGGGSVQN
jgi:hypothetical protein